jgi:hypothetical protein
VSAIDEELAALEAAEKAATPGPWSTQYDINVRCADGFQALGTQSTEFDGFERSKLNAALIAAARNALPKLIAEVRLLRAAVEADGRWGSRVRRVMRSDRKLGSP